MTNTPETRGHRFYPRLESARGVAAVIVVLGHCFGNLCIMRLDLPVYAQVGLWGFGTRTVAAVLNAQAAVLFFFVLSGFVISESVLSTQNKLDTRFFFVYCLRRVLRLYPAHLVILSAWMGGMYFLQGLPETPLLANVDLTPAYKNLYGIFLSGKNWPNAISLFENAALVSWSINPVTWSLCVEIFANIFIPAMAVMANTGQNFQKVVILCGLIWLMSDQMYTNPFLTYLAPFFAGALIRSLGPMVIAFLGRRIGMAGILALASALLVLPMALTQNRPAVVLICEACASWIIVAALVTEPMSPKFAILDHILIRHVGHLSYSLYLCHFLVMILLLRGVHYFWKDTPSHMTQAAYVGPFMVTCLLVSLAVAAALYKWAEEPGMKLGKLVSRLFGPTTGTTSLTLGHRRSLQVR